METALAYITYLDRLIIDGVKWFVDNNCWFYVIMCSIPFVGTALTRFAARMKERNDI